MDDDVFPTWAGADLFETDAAGAEDGGWIGKTVDNCAFEADVAGTTVQDEFDTTVEVLGDVLGGSWGWEAGFIRGWGSNWELRGQG